ncbi:MAG: GAF domain-containing protein [Chloroflexota bacterium]
MSDDNKSREQLVRELEARIQQTELLLQVSEMTASTLEGHEIMRRIVRVVAQALDADMTGAYIPDESGNYLQVAAGYHVPPERLEAYRAYRIPLQGHAIVEHAWQQRCTVWSGDVSHDARFDAKTLELFPARSILVTPMIVQEKPVGILFAVWWEESPTISEADERLVEGIVRQAAMALENARLFQEASSRAERLAVVNRIARDVGVTADLDGLMEAVYHEVAAIFAPDSFFIAFYRVDSHELDFRFVVDGGERTFPGRLPLGGLSESVIEQKKPLVIRDLQKEQSFLPQARLVGGGDLAASWMAAPMLVGEQVIGIINVQSNTPDAWDREDEQLFFTIVDQVAMAVHNAWLLDETRLQAREMGILNELSQALAAQLSVEQVLDQAYRGVSRLLDATNFYITLYDAATDEISFPLRVVDGLVEKPNTVRPKGRGGLTEYLIDSRQPLLIPENVLERIQELGIVQVQLASGRTSACWLGVPLMAGDEVLGTMVVLSYTTPRAYDAHHRDLLLHIANQTAVAVQGARLFEQTQAALGQMEALYAGSYRVVRATTFGDVLLGLAHSTVLQQMDRLMLALYDQPWPAAGGVQPDGLTVMAVWSAGNAEPDEPVGSYRSLETYPVAQLLALHEPAIVQQVVSDERLSTSARQKLAEASVGGLVTWPLVIGGQSIGCIVGWSTAALAWKEAEVRRVYSLVDQAATVVQSLSLLEQTQIALKQVQAVHQRYIRESWQSYAAARQPAYLYEGGRVSQTGQLELPRAEAAIGGVIASSISLQDQSIGLLVAESQDGRIWSDQEIALVESVANQLALAIENARLFEQTQQRAGRERVIRQITDKIRGQVDLDAILQTTVTELGKVLGASRAAICLGTEAELTMPRPERQTGEWQERA